MLYSNPNIFNPIKGSSAEDKFEYFKSHDIEQILCVAALWMPSNQTINIISLKDTIQFMQRLLEHAILTKQQQLQE